MPLLLPNHCIHVEVFCTRNISHNQDVLLYIMCVCEYEISKNFFFHFPILIIHNNRNVASKYICGRYLSLNGYHFHKHAFHSILIQFFVEVKKFIIFAICRYENQKPRDLLFEIIIFYRTFSLSPFVYI